MTPTALQAVQHPAADSPAVDSLAADSIVDDTIVPGEQLGGIVLVDNSAPLPPPAAPASGNSWGMSWVLLGMAILFCIIGLRFKNSPRFLRVLFTDLSDTRMRHNAFDDTVNETSLLFLLNLLWACCMGVFLWGAVSLVIPMSVPPEYSMRPLPDNPAGGIAICSGVALLYMLLMQLAYWTVGYVFTDSAHARIWLKGANASTALMAMPFLVIALLMLCYPQWNETLLIIAAIIFILGKIIFIFKGFRIFFTRFSSWLLFLYYLCSLEIVPLVFTAVAAAVACVYFL